MGSYDSGSSNGSNFVFGCLNSDSRGGQGKVTNVLVTVTVRGSYNSGSSNGFNLVFGNFDGLNFEFRGFDGDSGNSMVSISGRDHSRSLVGNSDGCGNMLNDR